MLPALALVFELALHGPELHSAASRLASPAIAPDARSAVSRVRDLVVALGTPLLAARTRSEFERALIDARCDPQLPYQLFEVARIAFQLDRRLPDLDPLVDLYSKWLGEEHRWKVRQIFNMSLELVLRSPEVAGTSLDEILERIDDVDVAELEPSGAVLDNFVCAAAAACAVDQLRVEISDIVRLELVNRWYETAADILGEVDPVQHHLDALFAREAHQMPEIRRLTYMRSVDAARIHVWALCDDTAEARSVQMLQRNLGDELQVIVALYDPDFDWSPIGARPAVGRGPAEDLIREFATLDELFAAQKSGSSELHSIARARWSFTRKARARIAGHERTLGKVAERLAREVANRDYHVVEFSLTAHVSPEAPSDEVLLEIVVAGLPDAAARMALWDHLSDSLAPDSDPFVIERLGIVVRRIYD